MTAWLGVSRTPIREALARLEQIGLVRTKPGSHTIVSPLDARAAHDAQAVTAAMHELAVRTAVPNLSRAKLDTMREANSRFAAALRHDDAAACANGAVRAVLEQFTPVLRRVVRLRFSSLSGRSSVAQHQQIIELCEAGDAEGAAAAVRANWQTLIPLIDDLPTDG